MGPNMPPLPLKAAISVTAMAQAVGLSRTRFYAYVRRGVFPYPIYSVATHRPYYTAEQQREILTTRQTGMTPEGEYVLFYERHPDRPTQPRLPRRPRHADLLDGLKALGLERVTAVQVEEALAAAFPNGVAGIEDSVVLRTVYRHLRRQGSV